MEQLRRHSSLFVSRLARERLHFRLVKKCELLGQQTVVSLVALPFVEVYPQLLHGNHLPRRALSYLLHLRLRPCQTAQLLDPTYEADPRCHRGGHVFALLLL